MQDRTRTELPGFLIRCGEGCTDYGYPDQLGNITVAVGCAVWNLAEWSALDWRNLDGSPASANAVQTAWTLLQVAAAKVRRLGPQAWPGGGHYAGLTSIRLAPASRDAIVAAKAAQFDVELRAGWPGYDDAPWQGQLALMRLAWACGTRPPKGCCAGGWPKLHAAWMAQDWATCAEECALPGIEQVEPAANGLERDLFLASVTA
jgi:hypothetical protein